MTPPNPYICLDEQCFLPDTLRGGVFALGVFDGVHLGHQAVFKQSLLDAQKRGTWAGAFSFATHPKTYFKKATEHHLLATLEEKIELCQAAGLQVLIMPPFNDYYCHLSAHDFIRALIKECLGAVHVVVGHDFHFGFQRQGNADWLMANAEALGIGVTVVEAVTLPDEDPSPHEREENPLPISSTWIRHALSKGQIEEANRLLGRPYSVTGQTFAGLQNGEKLGFPTLNSRCGDPNKRLPKTGVYITHSHTAGRYWPSITHIGTAPTLQGSKKVTPWLESYLLDDFSETAWIEKALTVHFHHRLRDEMRFETIDVLKTQIQQDVAMALAWHAIHPLNEFQFVTPITLEPASI